MTADIQITSDEEREEGRGGEWGEVGEWASVRVLQQRLWSWGAHRNTQRCCGHMCQTLVNLSVEEIQRSAPVLVHHL